MGRSPTCAICGKPVTLKQASDERSSEGWIIHMDCRPWTVRTIVVPKSR